MVQIADEKGGRRRRKSQPELVRVPVPAGSFFYVLRARRGSDPHALFSVAARCAPEVLTALQVPPDAAVRPFTPRVFPMRRAVAALCDLLPRTRLPPRTLAVGVLDPDGALCGGTQALLPLASDVRVVTRDAQRFAPDVFAARRRFGASLTVGEDDALLAGCDAVVCRAPVEATLRAPVVLSCAPAEDVFSLLSVQLPDVYARLCPRGVPPDLFAAALTEKCGVREAALYACRGVAFGGECPDAAQTAALWRARICFRREKLYDVK